MELGPADRVLLLTLPPLDEIRGVAIQVPDGLVVGMADAEALYEARAALRDYPNVMITPADPQGVIPWRDDFFTAVYAPFVCEPTPEMLRVVMPGGAIYVAGGCVSRR